MNRKTFYVLIAIGLSALFIYSLLRIFLILNLEIELNRAKLVKDLLAAIIVAYELFYAKRIFKIIGFTFIPFALVGFLFRIMHWPFGHIIFTGSIITIATVLIFNAIQSQSNRLNKLIILIYPFLRAMIMTNFFIDSHIAWWTSEVIDAGLAATLIWVRLAGHKLDAH